MKNLLLGEYLERAIRAHSWTSFRPEKRGEQLIKEFSAQLEEDLKSVEDQERYKKKYIELFLSWLSAKSDCASSMITGGSGFNVRRNEKANNREHARYNDFQNWREKALKAIERNKRNSRSEDEVKDELFADYKRSFESSAQTIIEIDKGINRYSSRALFVANMVGRIETLFKNGHFDLVERALELIEEYNDKLEKPLITKRHKIWKLRELAEDKKAEEPKENKTYQMDGFEIVINHTENRLQIVHESKPGKEVIAYLKKNGFRWSPKNTAWQRILTGNAMFSVRQMYGKFDQNL